MSNLPKAICVYGFSIPDLKIVETILLNRDHIEVARRIQPKLKRKLKNKLPASGDFLHQFRQFHEDMIADMFFKYGNFAEGAKLLSALASTDHVAGGPRFCVIEVRPTATGPSPFKTEVFNIEAGNADDAVMHFDIFRIAQALQAA